MNKARIIITAKIKDIRYQALIKASIKSVHVNDFDINDASSSCIVQDDINEIAISKWVSPKRTRSYPYARVYDTIAKNKRTTVIPVVKDEGLDGDRDFLQWDTICLMSLLQVFVIIGYYKTASRNPHYSNKVTKQRFDNDWIKERIKRLLTRYQSDALHWNIRQLREELKIVIGKQIEAYNQISMDKKVNFHSSAGLASFKEIIDRDLDEFMNSSRTRAEKAQSREIATLHIHERLETSSKSSITITNFIGGKYFFTVDEVTIDRDTNQIYLIESKHSNSAMLPSKADIKDGLLKMIIYTNLQEIEVEYVGQTTKKLQPNPVLRLTSSHVNSSINSNDLESLEIWCSNHGIRSNSTRVFLKQLFEEAQFNRFVVEIKNARTV